MSTKLKVVFVGLSLLTTYAIGRWAAPEKVVVKKEIVEVEKKTDSSSSEANKQKDTETHIIEHPDGTKETVITTHENWEKNHSDNSSSISSSSEKDSKEVTNSRSKVTISAMGGVNLDSLIGPPILGVSATKPILGPITVGLWGLSNKTLGASVGLTF